MKEKIRENLRPHYCLHISKQIYLLIDGRLWCVTETGKVNTDANGWIRKLFLLVHKTHQYNIEKTVNIFIDPKLLKAFCLLMHTYTSSLTMKLTISVPGFPRSNMYAACVFWVCLLVFVYLQRPYSTTVVCIKANFATNILHLVIFPFFSTLFFYSVKLQVSVTQKGRGNNGINEI